MITPLKKDNGLDDLISLVKTKYGIDLSGYRRNSLLRSVHTRVAQLKLVTIEQYIDYLQDSKQEATQLLNCVLIGVTDFFRDPEEWKFLAEEIIATLVRTPGPIRAWCAACSYGQEAYSLSILLCEALGAEEYSKRVRIFATDVNPVALHKAEAGVYSGREVRNVPADLLQRYFVKLSADSYQVSPTISGNITFMVHDALNERPLPDMDFISLRNVLIYLKPQAQSRMLSNMQISLKDTGFIFLGRNEVPRDSQFEHLDHKPVFRKMLQRTKLAGSLKWDAEKYVLTKQAFEVSPCSHLLVNSNGILIAANRAARSLFGVRAPNCGEPIAELPISRAVPDLTSLLAAASSTKQPITATVKVLRPGSPDTSMSLNICPILKDTDRIAALLLTFHE